MKQVRGASSVQSVQSYVPIPIDVLRVDSMTDFDLYLGPEPRGHSGDMNTGKPLWRSQNYVLYRNKNLPFTETVLQGLMENRVDVLYINSRDKRAYHGYVERNLYQLLEDPSLDVDTKSEALYTSARGLIRDVVEDPQGDQVIQRSGDFVQHAAKFMLSENTALKSLMNVMSYDYYTYTHSVNVFVYSLSLAQRRGIEVHVVLGRYGLGALLHDIGKSKVDPSITNCRGKLNAVQWESMKQHPEHGCDILRQQGIKDEIVLDVVRHHHEKLNGSGYPSGKQGNDISQLVRITTIADIFDALTTKRSYKGAVDSFPALKLMKEEMGDELDDELFCEFIQMIGADA